MGVSPKELRMRSVARWERLVVKKSGSQKRTRGLLAAAFEIVIPDQKHFRGKVGFSRGGFGSAARGEWIKRRYR